jgi:hypothetical protein
MLRGHYTVRMDEGPDQVAVLIAAISTALRAEFYVASLTGECARLYRWKNG